MLNYKGYIGEAVYDDETGNFAGKIANATAVGTFYGETVQDLEREFRHTIDYYLDLCQRKNIEPEKPFSGHVDVFVTPELHRKIYITSSSEGKNMDAWIKEKLESIVNHSPVARVR